MAATKGLRQLVVCELAGAYDVAVHRALALRVGLTCHRDFSFRPVNTFSIQNRCIGIHLFTYRNRKRGR